MDVYYNSRCILYIGTTGTSVFEHELNISCTFMQRVLFIGTKHNITLFDCVIICNRTINNQKLSETNRYGICQILYTLTSKRLRGVSKNPQWLPTFVLLLEYQFVIDL